MFVKFEKHDTCDAAKGKAAKKKSTEKDECANTDFAWVLSEKKSGRAKLGVTTQSIGEEGGKKDWAATSAALNEEAGKKDCVPGTKT
jgi:hypothetical protein